MNTPYSDIYVLFQDRIENDANFYIKGESEEVMMAFAKKQMKKLLNEAIYYMYTYDENDKTDFDVSFYEKDDILETFLFELQEAECQLIADVMFKQYIDKKCIEKLNALRNIGFKDDELVQFSPANTLKEFNSSLEQLKYKTNNSISAYKRRDRKTLKYKSFNYNFG